MNRIVYPFNLYPVTGDVESTAGSSAVKVVGLQTIPVDDTAPSLDGEILLYRFSDNKWLVTFVNDAVGVNARAISLNTILNIAGSTLVGAVDVNGTPIG